jgi:hypothetical protein
LKKEAGGFPEVRGNHRRCKSPLAPFFKGENKDSSRFRIPLTFHPGYPTLATRYLWIRQLAAHHFRLRMPFALAHQSLDQFPPFEKGGQGGFAAPELPSKAFSISMSGGWYRSGLSPTYTEAVHTVQASRKCSKATKSPRFPFFKEGGNRGRIPSGKVIGGRDTADHII